MYRYTSPYVCTIGVTTYYRISHNQKQSFVSSEVKNKALSIHFLHAFLHFLYFILSENSWCYKVMKVLTRTFMVERGCCKEKSRHHTITIGVFFTQDKSILKCSYVLTGTTYGKLWHQNKCCDVHFQVFCR